MTILQFILAITSAVMPGGGPSSPGGGPSWPGCDPWPGCGPWPGGGPLSPGGGPLSPGGGPPWSPDWDGSEPDRAFQVEAASKATKAS